MSQFKYFFTLFSALLLFSNAFGQCVPPAATGTPGLSPASLPAIQQGVPYNETVYIENLNTVNGITVTWLTVDSITNVPDGISYTITDASGNGIFETGETGCITFTGTTNDPVGPYPLGIYICVKVSILPSPLCDEASALVATIDQLLGTPSGISIAYTLDVTAGGSAACTPPAATGTPGLTPDWQQLPPIEQGVPYNESVSIENFSTVSGVSVTYLKVDSITNVPSGISYTIVDATGDGEFGPGETGCIQFSGTTNDSAGQYQLGIYICVKVSLLPSELCDEASALITTIEGLLGTPTGISLEYYLVVAGGGCTAPSAPIVSGTTNPTIGNLESYTASGSSGYSYDWSVSGGSIINGMDSSTVEIEWNSLGANSLSLTWTDTSGCLDDSVFVISVSCGSPVTPGLSGLTTLNADDTTVYSSPAVPNNTYNWMIAGGSILSGQGTDSIVVAWGNAGTGQLSVYLTDNFGCLSDTSTVDIIIDPVGINDLAAFRNVLKVFPNPVNQNLFIEVAGPTELMVANLLGEIAIRQSVNSGDLIDVSSLYPGIYFIYDVERKAVAKFTKQ